MKIELSRGVELFNNLDFFASHDYFEQKWNECDNLDKLFFQGLVQLSVGCYHLINNNYKGALSQFRKGKAKLSQYSPNYQKLNIKSLLEEVSLLEDDLILYFNNELERINTNKLPIIKIF